MDIEKLLNYGVSFGILVVVGLWLKNSVVEPLLKKHMELIDILKGESPKHTEALNEQTALLFALKDESKVQTLEQKQTNSMLKSIDQKTEKQAEIISAMNVTSSAQMMENTASIKEQNDILRKWGSDPAKLCQAAEVVRIYTERGMK